MRLKTKSPATADWQSDLKSYSLTSATPYHPGKVAIDKILTTLGQQLAIRDNPAPYGQINRIEPLVAAVTAVNEQLASDKRGKALLSIDGKIAEVQAKLTASVATPDTSNKALSPLQDLKIRIASQTSIAQILYLQGQGGDAMDDAIAIIEAVSAAAAKPVLHAAVPGDVAKPVTTGEVNVPAPVAKTTKVVRAAELSHKTYLETEADVDVYVAKLKTELVAAIRAGHIARIQ